MGYTTSFEGKFDFDRALTVPEFRILEALKDNEDWRNDKSIPQSWCQWTPTEDGLGLEWDGGEKFYCYTEWLHHIIRKYLTPWGITLSGSVKWQGEETGDVGMLVVANNEVVATQIDVSAAADLKKAAESVWLAFRGQTLAGEKFASMMQLRQALDKTET